MIQSLFYFFFFFPSPHKLQLWFCCAREGTKERSVREQIGCYFCLVRGFLLREFFFFWFGSSSEIRVFRFAIVRNSVPEKTEGGARSPLFLGFGAGRRAAVEEELAGCAST
jgi:hypothetical protein